MDWQQFLQVAAGRIVLKSALNPMLWLCAIITPVCWYAAYAFSGKQNLQPFCSTLVNVGAIPILVTCAGFIFFAIFKPEKLQSEEYQLKRAKLEIQMQGRTPEVLDITVTPALENPIVHGLPAQESEK